jgi:hypothetical protein
LTDEDRALSRSETWRLVVIVVVTGVVVGVPLQILVGALIDDAAAKPWLQGAALGAGIGIGGVVATRDLLRRRRKEGARG